MRALALISILASLALAWSVAGSVAGQIGQTFPGFLMWENGSVAPGFLTPRDRAADAAGLGYLARVTEVNGRAVSGAGEVYQRAAAVPPGTPMHYTVVRPGGSHLRTTLPTRRFTRGDFNAVMLPLLLGGMLLLAVASLPLLLRPTHDAARLLFVFSWATVTNYCFLGFDYCWQYRFTPWSYLIEFVSTATWLHFALVFPERRWPLSRAPRRALAFWYALVACETGLFVFALTHAPRWLNVIDAFVLGMMVVSTAVLTMNVAMTAARSRDPSKRRTARTVLAGTLTALVAVTLLVLATWGWADSRVPTYAYVACAAAFPAVLAYAIVRSDFFVPDILVRKGLSLAILVLTAALGVLAGFSALQRWAGVGTAWAMTVALLLIVVAAVPLAAPLRRRIETLLQQAFFPDVGAAAQVVHEASRDLVRIRDPGKVAVRLCDAIERTVGAQTIYVLVGRPPEPLTCLAALPEASLQLAATDPLARFLERGVTWEPADSSSPHRGSEAMRRRLTGLGVTLVVPFPKEATFRGGFLLGSRRDGRPYTTEQKRALETLASQAVVALDHAGAAREIGELRRQLSEDVVDMRPEGGGDGKFAGIVGQSDGIRRVLGLVERVAPTDATVLVLGETGSGKELVADALVASSGRHGGPYVKLACAAIPESLLESELFGHERGAFTGASERRLGRFEQAHRGTLLLDDVDTLPIGVQAKLLRALQEGEITRLGAAGAKQVDVRVIATSNQDLEELVASGRFREDLFYRLNVVPIKLPPLRERKADIPQLVQHLAERASQRLGRQMSGVAESALQTLQAHDWPGNVRELNNVVERAVVLSTDGVLTVQGPLRRPDSGTSRRVTTGGSLADQLRAEKTRLILEALQASGGNQRRAAELLGLHRPSLTRMIKDLGIRVPGRRLEKSKKTA